MATFLIKTEVSGGREGACTPERRGLRPAQPAAPRDPRQPAAGSESHPFHSIHDPQGNTLLRRCTASPETEPAEGLSCELPGGDRPNRPWVSAFCCAPGVDVAMPGREHRRGPALRSAGGHIAGSSSPPPALSFGGAYRVLALLANCRSAHFAPDAVRSPLPMLLTYLILTCLRRSLLLSLLSR